MAKCVAIWENILGACLNVYYVIVIKTPVATQRSDSLRAKFMAEVCKYDPSMFVWTDESGFNKRNSARKFGYGLRGIPPGDHRILVRGVRFEESDILPYQSFLRKTCMMFSSLKEQ